MAGIPWARGLDGTAALLLEGYEFGRTRFARLGSDVFATRLMAQPAVVMMGEEAARLFADKRHFIRHHALPHRVVATLTGRGSVHSLDDEMHAKRKQLFVTWLMAPERIAALVAGFQRHLAAAAGHWPRAGRVVLLREMERILCEAICEWAGVPLPAAEAQLRAGQLAALQESAWASGPRHWRGRLARARLESWISTMVDQVRRREAAGARDLLHGFAFHRDADGQLMTAHTVAVEVINVLRPAVGVARYIAFGVLAMHVHPAWYQRLATGDQEERERFIHEVRRFYPLVPMAVARVRESFQWRDATFPRHRRVLLDLYATNHDPRIWGDPETFRPDRFRQAAPRAFGLIPQGAGDKAAGHRCPGEALTVALAGAALAFLAGAIRYRVPPQNMAVDTTRMPAQPASGFAIEDVQLAGVSVPAPAGALHGAAVPSASGSSGSGLPHAREKE